MAYYYIAFGIPIVSEIELPALMPAKEDLNGIEPVHVYMGVVPDDLSSTGSRPDRFTYCNAEEMIFIIPEKIKFYVANGNAITIEPINPQYKLNLLYFYSNCLAAILFQRNSIPFHVSGIFVDDKKVALFAAPSRTGKSTLALKLQEMGYNPFTDDTAVLYVEKGKCYALASYPMSRLWQNTFSRQTMLQESDKQQLYEDNELDKYGFSFHKQFIKEPVEVEQIIFLEKQGGDTIELKPLSSIDAFVRLSNNVYRCHWIKAMDKYKGQFTLISHIIKTIEYKLISRPMEKDSYEELPIFIKKILQNKNK